MGYLCVCACGLCDEEKEEGISGDEVWGVVALPRLHSLEYKHQASFVAIISLLNFSP